MNRVDLFSVVHKGLRALLFELSADAARADVMSTRSVDALVARVEYVLEFFDEHAHLEEMYTFAALRAIDPSLADDLETEHRALDVAQIEVERAAHALSLSHLSARTEAGAQLMRHINQLTALQLMHMNREEIEVNARLWAGLDDRELAAVARRLRDSIPLPRYAEWQQILEAATNPRERRLVVGDPVR